MNMNSARRIAYRKVFSSEEMQDFLQVAGDDWSQGHIDKNVHDPFVRSVQSQPIELNGIMYEKLHAYVWAANQALWNFELTGLQDHDPPQLLRYGQGDHYDWHIDHDSQSSGRKLTCIVQLSDADAYVGGDVCIFPSLSNSSPNDWRPCGTLIIFPVYVPHCVTKIEKGARDALVFWVHGPSFR